MSVYAKIDGQEPTFFSSNSGWTNVIEWADDLDVKNFEDVVHLAEHGYSESVDELSEQLMAAIQSAPPADDVKKTLAELQDLLIGAENIFITNGSDG